ncbi:hypothetical protein [Nostoc commune]|uniref:hypothetical protein n=1 Tax=Nostoc commune TaxID=1178 RepID=UPI0018C76458|nr:hypothetical protein [Nostoc commune]MBG1258417.1 hypothetical protein [Nostoc commune BAE]
MMKKEITLIVGDFAPEYHCPFGVVYQSGESCCIYSQEKINVLGLSILPYVKIRKIKTGYSVSLDVQRRTAFVDTEAEMMEVVKEELEKIIESCH